MHLSTIQRKSISNLPKPDMTNPLTTNGQTKLVFVIFSLLLLLVASRAWACKCDFPTVEEDFKSSDVVFSGKVLRIDQIEDERRIKWGEQDFLSTVEVELDLNRVWKGTDETRKTVLTALHEPSCGYPFVVGNRYVVFANARKIEKDEKDVEVLYTHLCSANHERDYDRATQALLEQLEELKSTMEQIEELKSAMDQESEVGTHEESNEREE